MNALRSLFKLAVFALALFSFAILAMMVLIFNGLSIERARALLIKMVSTVSKVALFIMNIEVDRDTKELIAQNKSHLIVCNHLSYLDVFIISSIKPTCFVTSVEMKNTFFLGHLCQIGGCLFVDRRNRRSLTFEIKDLQSVLSSGLNVTIFPEATAGNGESLLKFRRPLYQSAIDAKVDVVALCLNYLTLDGEEVSLKNRDILFWHDDTPFIIHAFRFFGRKKLKVQLSELTKVVYHEALDKEHLSEQTFSAIKNAYREIR